MKPVGAALVGTGMWAGKIAAAVARTPALELVTCFGRDAARRAAFAAEVGCEAASSFETAVEDPRVEAVLLVTPNSTHAEQAVACAERGRHVFVEKPIADTLEDGWAIREACEAAGVTLLVGHGLRRLGAARAVERLLAEGDPQDPVTLSFELLDRGVRTRVGPLRDSALASALQGPPPGPGELTLPRILQT
ncbi:MAG: Gfo/Idh/MocA family protein, partial [Gaiellaceae bacterium]